jgi:hypothetical protein
MARSWRGFSPSSGVAREVPWVPKVERAGRERGFDFRIAIVARSL